MINKKINNELECIEETRSQLSNEHIQYMRCVPWFNANGDETLRLDYPLDENSLVLDVGGYKGEFASAMTRKYNCFIHTFEPIPDFYRIIKEKFASNNKVIAHCFVLGGRYKNG